ncbi:MAG: hypothetical protein M3R25_08970, partial [Bacteroidota bacterium]|nr:hypothetical protein [Bacteroidota bacterium]
AGPILGGIGRRSRELMVLLSSIGYDMIFLETVGVGQSEHIAWQLTDGFILVIQPGSGDELQGIKRGITELADIVAVNKSDGELTELARISAGHYRNALHYLSPLRNDWTPQVQTSSATNPEGIDNLWATLRLYIASRQKNHLLEASRVQQDVFWMQWSLTETARQLLIKHPQVNQKLTEALNTLRQNDTSVFKTEFEIETLMKHITASQDANNIKE